MPTHQKHRGAHPKDVKLFSHANIDILYRAARDLSELLTKGYAENGSLKLVGDHFQLKSRQRKALMRIAIPEQTVESIQRKQLSEKDVAGNALAVDGFNILIFTESLLGHGFLFEGMDGVFRDIASIHGTYKKVLETGRAVQVLGNTFSDLRISQVTWYLDAPVSNSLRLKNYLTDQPWAAEGATWDVQVIQDPDARLKNEKNKIVCTNDRVILERTTGWFNLSRFLVQNAKHHNPNVVPQRLT